jgi:hypothetical protein
MGGMSQIDICLRIVDLFLTKGMIAGMTFDQVAFRDQIKRARAYFLSQIDRVPIAALVWGPNPTSADPVAQTRIKLREALRSKGHLAEFSEDLYDHGSMRSPFAQQIAQAEAYDLVFSIPASYGAIAEIHDFARIPGISHKIIAFIDKLYVNGYSGQGLIAAQTSASCKIELYDGSALPDCIISTALEEVYRLQEILYVSGRR